MDNEQLSFLGWLVMVCGADFCGSISLILFIGLVLNLMKIGSKDRLSMVDSMRTIFPFLPLGLGITAAVGSLRMTLRELPEFRAVGYKIIAIQLTVAALSSGFLAIMVLRHRRRSAHHSGAINNTTDSKQVGPD